MALVDDILTELTAEISPVEGDKFNATLLEIKINGAYRDVQLARKYPSTYTSALIEADMANYESNIVALARFDYNQIGSEGQTQYSADGTSIHYVDRDKLFAGVLPISYSG